MIAGLTAAAVVIPKAMAYATIAGLPLQVRLYTVLVPMVIYAVLGTSRPLSVSTTATIAVLAAAQLGMTVPGGEPATLLAASATLAMLVGAMLVLASLLRFGFIAHFISEPVLTGFKAGIGVVIVVDQLPKLLGIHFVKETFVHNVIAIIGHLSQTSVATLVLAVALLVLIFGLQRLALGAANLGGGLCGAMPAGGGTTQTAVNRSAGAQSQMAALVTAAMALATMLVLAPLIAPLPQAALGAVVIAYSLLLSSLVEFDTIRRVRRLEFSWAIMAFTGVVVLGTLEGIVAAVIMSLLLLLHQTNNPPVYAVGRKRGADVFRPLSEAYPDDETFHGLLMLRVEGRVYFGNAHRVGEKMALLIAHAQPSVVVLDCSALTDLEYTALKMLIEAEERARHDRITLWLAALNPEVRHVVERAPLGQTLGRERMLFNLEAAVEQ